MTRRTWRAMRQAAAARFTYFILRMPSPSERKTGINAGAFCQVKPKTMRALLAAAVLSTSLCGASAFVDASQQTTVTVEAPMFDTNDSADNGCDPSGCQGSMTRVSVLQLLSCLLPRCRRLIGSGTPTCVVAMVVVRRSSSWTEIGVANKSCDSALGITL